MCCASCHMLRSSCSLGPAAAADLQEREAHAGGHADLRARHPVLLQITVSTSRGRAQVGQLPVLGGATAPDLSVPAMDTILTQQARCLLTTRKGQ